MVVINFPRRALDKPPIRTDAEKWVPLASGYVDFASSTSAQVERHLHAIHVPQNNLAPPKVDNGGFSAHIRAGNKFRRVRFPSVLIERDRFELGSRRARFCGGFRHRSSRGSLGRSRGSRLHHLTRSQQHRTPRIRPLAGAQEKSLHGGGSGGLHHLARGQQHRSAAIRPLAGAQDQGFHGGRRSGRLRSAGGEERAAFRRVGCGSSLAHLRGERHRSKGGLPLVGQCLLRGPQRRDRRAERVVRFPVGSQCGFFGRQVRDDRTQPRHRRCGRRDLLGSLCVQVDGFVLTNLRLRLWRAGGRPKVGKPANTAAEDGTDTGRHEDVLTEPGVQQRRSQCFPVGRRQLIPNFWVEQHLFVEGLETFGQTFFPCRVPRAGQPVPKGATRCDLSSLFGSIQQYTRCELPRRSVNPDTIEQRVAERTGEDLSFDRRIVGVIPILLRGCEETVEV